MISIPLNLIIVIYLLTLYLGEKKRQGENRRNKKKIMKRKIRERKFHNLFEFKRKSKIIKLQNLLFFFICRMKQLSLFKLLNLTIRDLHRGSQLSGRAFNCRSRGRLGPLLIFSLKFYFNLHYFFFFTNLVKFYKRLSRKLQN